MASFSLLNKPTEYGYGIEAKRGEVSRISLSCDGKIAYPRGNNLIVSDFHNLNQPLHVELSLQPITAVSFSSDASQLAYGSSGDIRILDAGLWKESQFWPNQGSGITMVEFSRDGKFLISASQSSQRAMKCHKLNDGKVLEGMPCNHGRYDGGIVSANKEIIGFSAQNNAIVSFKFSPLNNKFVRNLSHNTMCGSFLGETSRFVIPENLNSIRVYDFENLEPVATYTSPKQSRCYGFCPSPTNQNVYLTIHGTEKNVRLWDIEKGDVLHTKGIMEGPTKIGDMPVAAVWHQNEILVATLDGAFHRIDSRSAETIESVDFKPIEKHRYVNSYVSTVLPEKDGSSFIVGDTNGNMGKFKLDSDDQSKVSSHQSITQYKPDAIKQMSSFCKFDDSHFLQCRVDGVQLVTLGSDGKSEKIQKVSDINSESAQRIDDKNALVMQIKPHKLFHFNLDKITSPTEVISFEVSDSVKLSYFESNSLLAAYSRKMLKIYKVQISPFKLEQVHDEKSITSEFLDVSWSADGDYLGVLSDDGVRILKCKENFKKIPGLTNPAHNKATCLSWNPKGNGDDMVAIGYLSGSIAVCRVIKKSGVVPLILEREQTNRIISKMAWLNNDVLLASSSNLVRTYQIA